MSLVSTQHQTRRKVLAYAATLIISLPIAVFTLVLGLIAPLSLVVVVSFAVVGATAAFVGGAVSNVVLADGAFSLQRRVLMRTWVWAAGASLGVLILLAISTRLGVAAVVGMALVPWAAVRTAWAERSAETTWKRQTLEGLAWLGGTVIAATVAINLADFIGWA